MNFKRTLTGTLAIATLLLTACGDDDKPSPKEQFTFADETITLKEANIFLTDDETYSGENGNYREYIITDGQANGSGATFYIEVELANKVEDALEAGKYPAYYNWDISPSDENFGYVYFEMGEDEEYLYLDLLENADGDDDITVSGGLDDGETMTVKFNGTMEYYYYDTDAEEWVTDNVTGKFYFKGEVDDVTSSPAKVKQLFSGRGGNNLQ